MIRLTITVPIVVALVSGIGRFPVEARTSSLSVEEGRGVRETVVGVRGGSEEVGVGVKRDGEEVRKMEEGMTVPVVSVRVREEEMREVVLVSSSEVVVLFPAASESAEEEEGAEERRPTPKPIPRPRARARRRKMRARERGRRNQLFRLGRSFDSAANAALEEERALSSSLALAAYFSASVCPPPPGPPPPFASTTLPPTPPPPELAGFTPRGRALSKSTSYPSCRSRAVRGMSRDWARKGSAWLEGGGEGRGRGPFRAIPSEAVGLRLSWGFYWALWVQLTETRPVGRACRRRELTMGQHSKPEGVRANFKLRFMASAQGGASWLLKRTVLGAS